MEKIRKFIFEGVKTKLNKLYVLFVHLINLIVNYLYTPYGVPLHNSFENWTRCTISSFIPNIKDI